MGTKEIGKKLGKIGKRASLLSILRRLLRNVYEKE